jgi:hypothetical protein
MQLVADNSTGTIQATISGKRSTVQASSRSQLNTVPLSKAVLWPRFWESRARTATPKLLKCFAFCRAFGALLKAISLPTSTRTMDELGRMRTLSLEPFINSILLPAVMQLLFNRK